MTRLPLRVECAEDGVHKHEGASWGAFEYEEGIFKYLNGQSTIIEDIDDDRWSVFEAYEELRQLGYLQANIAVLWYKDPSLDALETSLKMLKGDADAIEMCNIAGLRGLVELYVVYDVGDAEPFPEVGYIDVGRVVEEGTDDGLGLVVFEGHEVEAAEASGEPNKGTEGGDEGDGFRVDGSGTSDEDSEDPEYMPSDEEGDSAGDVHFTDSEEEYEGDSGFDEDNSEPKKATAGKGKGNGISQFSDEDGADSDKLEIDHMIGGDEGDDNDAEDGADDVSNRGGQRFRVHKPLKDMSSYRWERLEVVTQQSQLPGGADKAGSEAAVVDPDRIWRETASEPHKNRRFRLGSFFANGLRSSPLAASSASTSATSPADLQQLIDLREKVQKLT
ncbi:hypothetical protein Ahy_B05g075524 [Arachis hypogaea]|uniref:PB1-like domain-containing protein n=1 Tax=Arachis hypogaea TaxID=3818 RepID=A0A444Z1R5_ARAHY|nr:hypothetical protein Ahy_B05g075524 [Arachis hypogaea]